jgi:Uma2 family endonuclease
VIEIRSPDQSILDLQNKILHCLTNGTQLVWLIDIQRQQIWVWQAEELPIVYAGDDILPVLSGLPSINANVVIALTHQRRSIELAKRYFALGGLFCAGLTRDL